MREAFSSSEDRPGGYEERGRDRLGGGRGRTWYAGGRFWMMVVIMIGQGLKASTKRQRSTKLTNDKAGQVLPGGACISQGSRIMNQWVNCEGDSIFKSQTVQA